LLLLRLRLSFSPAGGEAEESLIRDWRRASAAISTSVFRRPSEHRISIAHPPEVGLKVTAIQWELVLLSSILSPDAVFTTKLNGSLLVMCGTAGPKRASLTEGIG